MREREVELHLVNAVGDRMGMTAKMTVAGRRGWPDRLVILPGGKVALVELKRPKGGKLSLIQKTILRRLTTLGVTVATLTTKEAVDKFLADFGRLNDYPLYDDGE